MTKKEAFKNLVGFGFTALEALDILADKKARVVAEKLPKHGWRRGDATYDDILSTYLKRYQGGNGIFRYDIVKYMSDKGYANPASIDASIAKFKAKGLLSQFDEDKGSGHYIVVKKSR